MAALQKQQNSCLMPKRSRGNHLPSLMYLDRKRLVIKTTGMNSDLSGFRSVERKTCFLFRGTLEAPSLNINICLRLKGSLQERCCQIAHTQLWQQATQHKRVESNIQWIFCRFCTYYDKLTQYSYIQKKKSIYIFETDSSF